VPSYRNQSIGLQDVRVEGRAPRGDQARRILKQTAPAAAYRQELLDFSVPQTRVMPDALVVTWISDWRCSESPTPA
jgi:hypothetical protein